MTHNQSSQPPTTSPRHYCRSTRNNRHRYSTHPVHAAASNLANLLPTSTVLAFRALSPSFTNRGTTCIPANRFLTSILLAISAFICFLSSFTDSFVKPVDGKLYYGIATFKGLCIFNYGTSIRCNIDQEDGVGTDVDDVDDLKKFNINGVDIVHGFVSLIVFLVFAISDTDVQSCLFPQWGANLNVLLMNSPLGVGILASFLFTIFPTTRRGLGYADFHLHEECQGNHFAQSVHS